MNADIWGDIDLEALAFAGALDPGMGGYAFGGG